MKALTVLAFLALAACHSPLEPAPPRTVCTQGSEFTWYPAVTAAGDTIAWYGICGYVH